MLQCLLGTCDFTIILFFNEAAIGRLPYPENGCLCSLFQKATVYSKSLRVPQNATTCLFMSTYCPRDVADFLLSVSRVSSCPLVIKKLIWPSHPLLRRVTCEGLQRTLGATKGMREVPGLPWQNKVAWKQRALETVPANIYWKKNYFGTMHASLAGQHPNDNHAIK